MPRFAEFVRRKERAARAARLKAFETIVDNSAQFALESISCRFTDALLDGPFFQSPVLLSPLPSTNLVMVQSRDGNTGASDPSGLGGGNTDKHVIYEGLSRVAADAVMAGAGTARGGNVVFSLWHPVLVDLRRQLGKPRHPDQIVTTGSGDLPIEDGLLFNVPEIRVVIVTTDAAAPALAERSRRRPWIAVIASGDGLDLRAAAAALRRDCGIRRISAIGGRTLATALLDAGLVSDLYLTTGPRNGGEPNTPMYVGAHAPTCDLVVRRQSSEGVVFEHSIVRTH